MGATIEIAYYNTFILAGGGTAVTNNGTPVEKEGEYHVEEARLHGGYNEPSVDFGVRAHITNEKYQSRVRENALIYSGIYNSRTDVNKTNEFSIGEDITKSVDIANGSIQKLHAEDTNLNVFQENKVSSILIDKDAIYTAEGQPITSVSNVVMGEVVPYLGKYGISKNPESFAFFGNRKYFVDKNRGMVLRLSRDGLTPISDYGMRDFFKDKLPISTKIYGMYDEQKGHYIVSLQGDTVNSTGTDHFINVKRTDDSQQETSITDYLTLNFGEGEGGWISFYTYKPIFGFSLRNNFYTYYGEDLYIHYNTSVPRNNFYGAIYNDPSYVNTIFNEESTVVKSYLTLNYDGSTGWDASPLSRSYTNMKTSGADATTAFSNSYYTSIAEEGYKIPKEGVIIPNVYPSQPAGFVRKEGKYFGFIKNKNNDRFFDNSQFTTTGLTGNYLDTTFKYWHPSETESANKAELFSISSEVQLSSK